MPTAKVILQKALCVDDLRHVEYYGLQETFDGLYAKSKEGGVFTDLMGIILSRENILLAYRNIKSNKGSKTRGTDNVTIDDIGRISPEEVVEKTRFIVTGSPYGYRPRPVRRKDIPKPNGSTRPHVCGTGWCSNASSRSWSRFVRQNSANIATGSARSGRWKTQSQKAID